MVATAPQRHESVDDGEFETFSDLPVFDEHTGDDGVVYNKALLQQITNNNNHRIRDTGDWCPIVMGHTPDSDHPGEQPEIIGFAGPFRLSVIGNVDPRHCIFADFRVHKEHAEAFRKNPRRSVELWPEEEPSKRFFDPIAVLGAETPKRPLGLTYSKAPRGKLYTRRMRGARRPIKYEMGAEPASEPGAHNTFIPSGIKKKKKPIPYNLEGVDMNPEELAQMVEALTPLIESVIDERMNALHENEPGAEVAPAVNEAGQPITPQVDTTPGALAPGLPPEPMAGAESLPPVAEGPPMEMPSPAGELPPGEPPLPPEGEMPAQAGPPEEVPPKKKEPSPFRKYACGKTQQFMAGDESPNKTGAMDKAMAFAKGLDDEDRADYMDMLSGTPENDDEKDFYKKVAYGLGGGDPLGFVAEQGDSLMAAQKSAKALSPEAKDYRKRYRKAEAAKNDMAEKFAKAQTELAEVRTKERYAKRHGSLESLAHEGFVLDTPDELDRCAGFDDDQFDSHLDCIRERYQKAGNPGLAAAATRPDYTPPDTKADQYADAAAVVVQKYRKEDKEVTFRAAIKNIIANDGKYVPETASA